MRLVQFHRRLRGFNGGHLKVWHYFNHVKACPGHSPVIYFTPDSVWDERNPWRAMKNAAAASWNSIRPDLLFLAGMDWLALEESQRDRSPAPIINLIQHATTTSPDNPRNQFLKHHAIRICVSRELAADLERSRQANGPIVAIPVGIDLQELPRPLDDGRKECGLLIAAFKRPDLGVRLFQHFADTVPGAELLTEKKPRPEFLARVNRARVTVFLPYAAEAFYLPALEAMALRTVVVCPDCVGNRSFCSHGSNCYRPECSFDAILNATREALDASSERRRQIQENALGTVAEHDLQKERAAFHEVLRNVPELWKR